MSVSLAPFLKQRFLDANGNPLAGGKLYAYQAGTSTPQDTYTDSTGVTANANPVVMDANGEANVWLDQELSYKFILKDSSDVTQWTVDGVIGLLTVDAVATASLQDGSVTSVKIADDAVTADKLRDDASTDGNRAVTTNHIRDSAVTTAKIAAGSITQSKLGAGSFGVGASGIVSKTASFNASVSEDGYLVSTTLGAVTATLPAASGNGGKFFFFKKTDSSANALLIDGNASETIDGFTSLGLYAQNQELVIYCDGTNWQVLSSPTPLIVRLTDTKAEATDGGTCTSGSWFTRTLNTGAAFFASLSSNEFTLPAGEYEIEASAPGFGVGAFATRIYNVTDASVVAYGSREYSGATTYQNVSVLTPHRFSLSAEKTLRLEMRSDTTRATDGLGRSNASNLGGSIVYSQVTIRKIR